MESKIMLTSVREANTDGVRAEDGRPSYRASSKMRRPNDLKLGTVRRVAEARLPTEFGEFRIIAYRSLTSTEEFVVLVRGELRADRPSLARIHSQCMTGADKTYRTTPLRGLFAHMKRGFNHGGRFPTLLDVVNHYNDFAIKSDRAREE